MKLSSRASALKALMEGERAKVEQLTDGFAKFAEKALGSVGEGFGAGLVRFQSVLDGFGAGMQVDGSSSNQHLEDQLQDPGCHLGA